MRAQALDFQFDYFIKPATGLRRLVFPIYDDVHLDFETFSELKLPEVGAYKYSMHKSTEVICLVFSIGAKKYKWHCYQPIDQLPFKIINHVASGGIVNAHNAEFEFCIWNYVLNWGELKISQLRCSAARAAVLAIPRDLARAAKVLKLPVKKDKEGYTLMMKMCKPRKPTKNNKAVRHIEPQQVKRLVQYCATDVVVERGVDRTTPPLSSYELKVFHKTIEMNNRGVLCDVDLCRKAVHIAGKHTEILTEELEELTSGNLYSVNQHAKFLSTLEDFGLDLPNMQKKTVEDALLEKGLPKKAKRLLELRRDLGKSSIAKYHSMLNMACDDNRLRGLLMYHGASTGRWTGKGVQPQNFFRPVIKDVDSIYKVLSNGDYDFFSCFYDDVLGALASALRGMLIAAPGKVFHQADFSAIEARMLAFLAQDFDSLHSFEMDIDVYIKLAAKILGIAFRDVTPEQRQGLGKPGELSCGFGIGHDALQAKCERENNPISTRLAKLIVKTYRKDHAPVVKFWEDLEEAAFDAVRSPGINFKVGRLTWRRDGRWLKVRLPSGRLLYYCDPHIKSRMTPWGQPKLQIHYWGVDAVTKQWRVESTYGGKLCENVVQACARCVMTSSMLRVDRHGWSNLFTVHDEVLTEENPQQDFEKFLKLMAINPKWAGGLPTKVEGWVGERYRK